ncbi:MAG: hypothetical protein Q9170_005473 [Blastenia crenularia]
MDPQQEYHSGHALSHDVENSFFRSWALRARTSEYSSTSDVSPGTKSPPVSPRTAVRPRRRDRPNFESRFSDSHVHRISNSLDRSDWTPKTETLSPIAPSNAVHQQTSANTRTSVGSFASKTSSNASSIAKRALSRMKGSDSPRSSITKWDRKPTTRARGDFSWKREVSGHFFEINVGRKAESDAKLPGSRAEKRPDTPLPTPAQGFQDNLPPADIVNQSKVKRSLDQPLHKSTDSSSPEDKGKKSIVSRTKHILGITSSPVLSKSIPSRSRTSSQTGDTLNHASSALREIVDKHKLTPPSGSTSTSNLSAASIAGKPKRRRPWHRSGDHREHTGHSSSSSVRRIKLGKPPVSTPNDDCMYTGSDAQQYFRVELTEPNAPTYLPSEARRIGTPPLPGNNGSKLRGFFFDYNAPKSAGDEEEGAWPRGLMNTAPLPLPQRQRGLKTPSLGPPSPRSPGARLRRNVSDNDWFRVRVAMDEAKEENARFELNAPEHLPSSPLCPKHPKHKSGGKGVCVYHGRNKTESDDVVDVGAGWR